MNIERLLFIYLCIGVIVSIPLSLRVVLSEEFVFSEDEYLDLLLIYLIFLFVYPFILIDLYFDT